MYDDATDDEELAIAEELPNEPAVDNSEDEEPTEEELAAIEAEGLNKVDKKIDPEKLLKEDHIAEELMSTPDKKSPEAATDTLEDQEEE